MRPSVRQSLFIITLMAMLHPLQAITQNFNCNEYENYAGLEPEGYAAACLSNVATPPSVLEPFEGLAHMAFAHELRNTRNTVFHSHEDLSDHTVIGLSTSIIFGYDYSPDLGTLYGINFGTGQLGTSDGITFTPLGHPTRPEGHTWSGLAIDPVTGEAFLSSTDSSVSILQSVDRQTAESTVIGNMGELELVIEIAINCEGTMYAHDIGSDAIYTIDRSDGTPTLVGPHGLKTNFAQGMDFNNQTGDLYIYAYTGGGSITYGRVNLATGAIIPLNVNDPEGEWEGASKTTCPGRGPARFRVEKDFDDDNPARVDVAIECNTGLPLSQQATLAEGDPITFVVGDFIDGQLDCEISETVPEGYLASYDNGAGLDATACHYRQVEAGSSQTCKVSNALQSVSLEATKIWIDENPRFNPVSFAAALWTCSNVAFNCEEIAENNCDSGRLEFVGNPGSDSFSVYPSWDGGTNCNVRETGIGDGNIESDDGECRGVLLYPGVNGACTIVNTRLYAGIPALGRNGLAALVLLMLSAGLFVYRRLY